MAEDSGRDGQWMRWGTQTGSRQGRRKKIMISSEFRSLVEDAKVCLRQARGSEEYVTPLAVGGSEALSWTKR